MVGNIAVGLIYDIIKESMNPSKGSSIEEIQIEANKQNVSLEIAQQQSRVAQEIAIALRTVTADEVEIEEFYDNTGEGNAGLNGNKEGISLGISGSGRKITKRVYKFKGYNEKNIEMYEQKFNEMLSTNTNSESEKTK